MNCKNFLLLFLLTLLGLSSHAQKILTFGSQRIEIKNSYYETGDRLYANNVNAAPGDVIELNLYLDRATAPDFTNIQFSLVFPEGVTPCTVDGEYCWVGADIPTKGGVPVVSWTENCGTLSNWPKYTFVGVNMSKTKITADPAHIITVYMKVDDNAAGDLTLRFNKLMYTTYDSDAYTTTEGDVCNISVQGGEPTSISLDKQSMDLSVGASYKLTATVLPQSAYDKTVTWSSSNPAIASVTSDGTVTGVSAGGVMISAQTVNGLRATCVVNVDNNPTSITLNKTSLALNLGDTETLIATVLPETAIDKTVTWTSSNPSVAQVSSSGMISAVGGGSAEITATTINGITAKCNVTVYFVPTSISLSQTTLSIKIGESKTLTANVYPNDAHDKAVTWSTSNSSIATVNSSGVVTMLAAGTATITATTWNGLKANCTVNAIVEPTSVSLNKTSSTLNINDSETLVATLLPTNVTEKTLTWTSSNTTVATVTNTGVVTAKAGGNATITVTTVNGLKATCYYTVVVPPTGISLNKSNVTIEVGSTETLTATITPTNATDKSVTWSSSNISVATVSAAGVITAHSVGTATITAETCNGIRANCNVNVIVMPTSISLSKTSSTLTVGSTETLVATVLPDNATDKSLTWVSSNSSVVTVSSTGVVTAIGAGNASVTAITLNGLKATCYYNVVIVPTGITLNKTAISLEVGTMETLSATVTPSNATDKTVSWSTSDQSVATVTAAGLVTAKAAGNATITATTSNGITATCAVTVTIMPTSIALDKTLLTMDAGTSETLYATVLPNNATSKTVTWSSNNTVVVRVSDTGKVTAYSEGNATITATTVNGLTATCDITVKNNSRISAQNVRFAPGENSTVKLSFSHSSSNFTTVQFDLVFPQGIRPYKNLQGKYGVEGEDVKIDGVTFVTFSTNFDTPSAYPTYTLEGLNPIKTAVTANPAHIYTLNISADASVAPGIYEIKAKNVRYYDSAGLLHETGVEHVVCNVIVKGDELIYAEDAPLTLGGNTSIDLMFKRTEGDNFTNIQFDVIFPEGIRPYMDEEGDYGFSGKDVVPYVSFSDNFALASRYPQYTVVGANMSKKKITVNPAHLYTLNIAADENIAPGSYPLIIKNVKYVDYDDKTHVDSEEKIACMINVKNLLRGDVNLDGEVDVTDMNIVINIILNLDDAESYDGRADLNGDGVVDISDLNILINIVLKLDTDMKVRMINKYMRDNSFITHDAIDTRNYIGSIAFSNGKGKESETPFAGTTELIVTYRDGSSIVLNLLK